LGDDRWEMTVADDAPRPAPPQMEESAMEAALWRDGVQLCVPYVVAPGDTGAEQAWQWRASQGAQKLPTPLPLPRPLMPRGRQRRRAMRMGGGALLEHGAPALELDERGLRLGQAQQRQREAEWHRRWAAPPRTRPLSGALGCPGAELREAPTCQSAVSQS
jgi:hypothetical protein